jgi:predicted MFS family arabinose efflux permease
MIALSAVLWRMLPARAPVAAHRYGRLLRSAVHLIAVEPVLRRRAVCQALMFGAFSAFWTSIAYELVDAHHLSQLHIAVFALVGAGGAAAALVAGKLGDRGLGRPVRGLSMVVGAGAMVLAGLGSGSVILLACAAVLLDLATQGNQVISQRDVYALREDARARLNTVYMTVSFIGGSIASAVSGWLYQSHGWTAVTIFAAALPLAAGCIYLWEFIRTPAPVAAAAETTGA